MEYACHSPTQKRWFIMSATPIRSTNGGAVITHTDITLRKIAEGEHLLAGLIFANSNKSMMITDSRNHIISVNPAFTSITGYDIDDVLGKNPSILKSSHQSKEFYSSMWKILNETGSWDGELWNKRKNGDFYAVHTSINKVMNPDGTPRLYISVFSDITHEKEYAEELQRISTHDDLTQLPNRRLFYDRLEQEIKISSRYNYIFAVVFIDLDYFKEVNDKHGHIVGDELLRQVSKRLQSLIREIDTVSRIGGDEFTIILTNFKQIAFVSKILESITKSLSDAFFINGNEISISASLGVSIYPTHAVDAEGLLAKADAAMYVSKNTGRNRYTFEA